MKGASCEYCEAISAMAQGSDTKGASDMNQRIETARAVAAKLLSTETAIDAALAEAADLAALLPRARQDVRVSVMVGQDALDQVLASLTTLAQARRMMAAAHQSLAEASHAARVPPMNFGGFVDKPSHKSESGLAVVA
jgi:hypothetical protein